MNKLTEISIIVPCFNESDGLSHLVSKLGELEARLSESHEFIFVDDGSSDNTFDKLQEIYKDRIGKDVFVIKHFKNMGVGAGVRTGVLNSSGRHVAVIDSDCSYEPAYVADMLAILKKEKADIITASPYHPGGLVLNVPRYRLFLSKTLSRIYNIITRGKIYTYTSMFRVYRKAAIEDADFESDGFLAMAEILVKAQRKDYKIIEYPASLIGRKFGFSKAKVLCIIKEHILFIMKLLRNKV